MLPVWLFLWKLNTEETVCGSQVGPREADDLHRPRGTETKGPLRKKAQGSLALP